MALLSRGMGNKMSTQTGKYLWKWMHGHENHSCMMFTSLSEVGMETDIISKIACHDCTFGQGGIAKNSF